jgi:hypothetical protein
MPSRKLPPVAAYADPAEATTSATKESATASQPMVFEDRQPQVQVECVITSPPELKTEGDAGKPTITA